MLQDARHPLDREQPRRIDPGDPALPGVMLLLQGAFSYMDGRIDPPSSMLAMTPESLADTAANSELWVIGAPPQACMVLTPRPEALYLGKLAVAHSARGRGLARRLVDLSELRARALNLPFVELQTRVELVENHATFAALGFEMAGETAHPGFDHPTSLTFRRRVAEPGGSQSLP